MGIDLRHGWNRNIQFRLTRLHNRTTSSFRLFQSLIGIVTIFQVYSFMQIVASDQRFTIDNKINTTHGGEKSFTSTTRIRGLVQQQQQDLTPQKVRESSQTRRLSPSIGNNIRALVLLVQFPEHDTSAIPLPTREYFDTMCNTHIIPYLQKQSYGRYNIIACDVQEWKMTEYSQEFYSSSQSNLVGSEFASDFFIPVLQQLDVNSRSNTSTTVDSSTDDGISDWTIYDTDQDGRIDAVVALHSGFGAEYRNIGDCNISDYSHRIHSQGHNDSSGDWYDEIVDGYQSWTNYDTTIALSGYAIASAYDFICTDIPATPGTITHEWIHIFGAPDLYGSIVKANSTTAVEMDIDVGRISIVEVDLKVRGLGSYDVMSNSFGPLIDGFPASLSVYTKNAIGWMTPVEIIADGTYTLAPVHLDPTNAYVIRHPIFATDEYILIEYRSASEYDVNLFGGGLLIYHVDDNQRVQGGSSYPYGSAESHMKVAVLQSDGKYDIELGNNNGDNGDFWKTGMMLEPSGVNSTKDDLFYPNTDSYYNGPTGLSIYIGNISTVSGDYNSNRTDVTIRVTGVGANNSTMPPIATPSPTSRNLFPTANPSIGHSNRESDSPSFLSSNVPSDVPSVINAPIPSEVTNHHSSLLPSTSPSVTLLTLQPPAGSESGFATSESSRDINTYYTSTTVFTTSFVILFLRLLES